MKKALSIVLCMVLVLSLAACGGGSGGGKADVVGTYTLYEMTTEGTTISNDMLTSLGMDEIFLEMKEDGTGSMTIDGEASGFKWDDKNIHDETTGDDIGYTYKDGKLTMNWDGSTMVFQKK